MFSRPPDVAALLLVFLESPFFVSAVCSGREGFEEKREWARSPRHNLLRGLPTSSVEVVDLLTLRAEVLDSLLCLAMCLHDPLLRRAHAHVRPVELDENVAKVGVRLVNRACPLLH